VRQTACRDAVPTLERSLLDPPYDDALADEPSTLRLHAGESRQLRDRPREQPTHDDLAIVVAMAAAHLIAHSISGHAGSVTVTVGPVPRHCVGNGRGRRLQPAHRESMGPPLSPTAIVR
jgi:hypothetical protein